jgi:thioredoxin 1
MSNEEKKYVIEGTSENFNKEVMEHKGVVLVEFWATWCGHCRMFAPTIEKFAEEKKDEIKVVTINIDNEQELSKKVNIKATPTLILFKDGKRKKITTGSKSKQELESWVESSVKDE